jgi:putative spermidine/putrescine transport system permease protein
VALVMVRAPAWISRAVTAIVVAPMVVSVVVRTYGWQLILGNSHSGLLNWMLQGLGVIETPLRLLYSETAVVIGSLHVYFPMMVLPLASALGKMNPALEEAARTLGAPAWRVFSSYVTPAILGGTHAPMLGMLIQEQVLAVYDWPFGSVIATVLVATVLAANFLGIGMIGAWLRRGRTAA